MHIIEITIDGFKSYSVRTIIGRNYLILLIIYSI